MATITITFDTVEKTMSVTRDGAEIPNVTGASVGRGYCDDDGCRCEIYMHERDDAHKTDTYHRLIAADVAPNQRVPGFSVAEALSVNGRPTEEALTARDIADWMGK
jgi:hypothetical protein